MCENVTHAHIGKLWVFDFCMIRLPFIVTVQENVTRVHIGRLYVFLFLYDKVIFYYYGPKGCYACAYFVCLFPTFICVCLFPMFYFCVFCACKERL